MLSVSSCAALPSIRAAWSLQLIGGQWLFAHLQNLGEGLGNDMQIGSLSIHIQVFR